MTLPRGGAPGFSGGNVGPLPRGTGFGGPRGTGAQITHVLVRFTTQYERGQLQQVAQDLQRLQREQVQAEQALSTAKERQLKIEQALVEAQRIRFQLANNPQTRAAYEQLVQLTQRAVNEEKQLGQATDQTKRDIAGKLAFLSDAVGLTQQQVLLLANENSLRAQATGFIDAVKQAESEVLNIKGQQIAAQQQQNQLQQQGAAIAMSLRNLFIGALGATVVGGALTAVFFEPLQDAMKGVKDLIGALVDPAKNAEQAVADLGKAVRDVASAENLTNLQAAQKILSEIGGVKPSPELLALAGTQAQNREIAERLQQQREAQAGILTGQQATNEALAQEVRMREIINAVEDERREHTARGLTQLKEIADVYKGILGDITPGYALARQFGLDFNSTLNSALGISEETAESIAQTARNADDAARAAARLKEQMAEAAREAERLAQAVRAAEMRMAAEVVTAAFDAQIESIQQDAQGRMENVATWFENRSAAIRSRAEFEAETVRGRTERRVRELQAAAEAEQQAMQRAFENRQEAMRAASERRIASMQAASQRRQDAMRDAFERQQRQIQDRIREIGERGPSERTQAIQREIEERTRAEELRRHQAQLADIAEQRRQIILRENLRLTKEEIDLTRYQGRDRIIAIDAILERMNKQNAAQERFNRLLDIQYQFERGVRRQQGESIREFIERRAQFNRQLLQQAAALQRQGPEEQLREERRRVEVSVQLKELEQRRRTLIDDRERTLYMRNLQERLQASQQADRERIRQEQRALQERLRLLQRSHQEQMRAEQRSLQARMQAERRSLQERLREEQRTHREAVRAHQQASRDRIAETQRQAQREIAEINRRRDADIQAAKDTRDSTLASIRRTTEERIAQLRQQQRDTLWWTNDTNIRDMQLVIRGARTKEQLQRLAGQIAGAAFSEGYMRAQMVAMGVDNYTIEQILRNVRNLRTQYDNALARFSNPNWHGGHAKGGLIPLDNAHSPFGQNVRFGEEGPEAGLFVLNNQLLSAIRQNMGQPLVGGDMIINQSQDPWRDRAMWRREMQSLIREELRSG